MKIPFVKYHGSGNDFILIDNRNALHSKHSALIQRLCDRNTGIGADGVLFLQMSQIADYQMRIFNADGSEPSMCGNGICCVFDFLVRETEAASLKIDVAGRIFSCHRIGDRIAVNLGVPRIIHWPISLDVNNHVLSAYVLDTGVVHTVIFVENIMDIAFSSLGQQIRGHPAFAPHGTNVNFVQHASDGSILLRTYEKGVEAETLSCGTGAAAAAWAAAHTHGVTMRSSIPIKTRASFQTEHFEESMRCSLLSQEIEIIGRAQPVFTGEIDLKHVFS